MTLKALANAVLGGNTTALPSGMSISTLSGILESLNMNFHEGTVNNGLLGCVAPNRPPNANNDAATAFKGDSIYVSVLGNDSDPDGNTLSLKSVTNPSKGTVAIQSTAPSSTPRRRTGPGRRASLIPRRIHRA